MFNNVIKGAHLSSRLVIISDDLFYFNLYFRLAAVPSKFLSFLFECTFKTMKK